ADLAFGAEVLDALSHRRAQLAQARPALEERRAVLRRRNLVGDVEEHAVVLPRLEDFPELLGRQGEDRREESHVAVRDVPERRLRRARGARAGAAGVEAALENVEIEGAEVLGAEALQPL